MDLAKLLLDGDRRALARAITLTENEDPMAVPLAAAIYPHTGKARVIGVTGPPGAGKSTLVDGLAHKYREAGQRVAIIAVDPTSPFTGGAILGDRIRMRRVAADPNVYMRSLATRGHLGGLSWHTGSVIRLLDAAGFDTILVETVGTGQAEVEIMRYAETTVVVMVPGLGDEVQAIKAGILEIADVLVVNKADREGADSLARELEMTLRLGEPARKHRAPSGGEDEVWVPPVIKTVASADQGLEELIAEIARHNEFLRRGGGLEEWRRSELEAELRDLVRDLAGETAHDWAVSTGLWQEAVSSVLGRSSDPRSAASMLVSSFIGAAGDRTRTVGGRGQG